MNRFLKMLAWPHPRERTLTSYADGEAGPLTAMAVGVHLQNCRQCRDKGASHEFVLLTMAHMAHSVEEPELSRMVAEGRTRLLRSIGGADPRQQREVPNPHGKAELIFGCRIPVQQESNSDATLDEMYSALLGSRAIEAPRSR